MFFCQFENASDMIVSLVFLLVEEFLQDHKKLPRKLHLNLGKSSKLCKYMTFFNDRIKFKYEKSNFGLVLRPK